MHDDLGRQVAPANRAADAWRRPRRPAGRASGTAVTPPASGSAGPPMRCPRAILRREPGIADARAARVHRHDPRGSPSPGGLATWSRRRATVGGSPSRYDRDDDAGRHHRDLELLDRPSRCAGSRTASTSPVRGSLSARRRSPDPARLAARRPRARGRAPRGTRSRSCYTTSVCAADRRGSPSRGDRRSASSSDPSPHGTRVKSRDRLWDHRSSRDAPRPRGTHRSRLYPSTEVLIG